MANNRMYLVHRPSGLAVYLGKRMRDGWYGAPDELGSEVSRLFDAADEYGEGQDDFALTMEENDEAFPWTTCSRADNGLLHLTNDTAPCSSDTTD